MPSIGPQTNRDEQRLVLAVAVLASFAAFLDGSIVNVALPAIARELHGGLVTQQWTVDSYLVTLGALILLAGSLSDALGRVAVLRVGLVAFAVASLCCAAAPNPEWLISARAVQGAAGALLVPSSLALITSTFEGSARSAAIGRWTAFTTVAFIAGPLAGGLIVDHSSWRVIFLINMVPIGITLILLARLTPRNVARSGVRIDYPGAVLCVIGLGGIVFALIEQQAFGWASPAIVGSLVVGIVSFAGFLVRQRFAASPLMPLHLFAVRNFSVGTISTAFIYAALSLGELIIVLFLQQVAGQSATVAALATLPIALLNISLAGQFGSLAGRFGPRIFMSLGPAAAAGGYLLMLASQKNVDYWTELLPGIILFGLGLSATVAPLTATILGAVTESQAGIASAVNNAVSRVAGLVSVAFLGVIVGPVFDTSGFHVALVVTAALLAIGGGVSAIGISNVQGGHLFGATKR